MVATPSKPAVGVKVTSPPGRKPTWPLPAVSCAATTCAVRSAPWLSLASTLTVIAVSSGVL
ncbi:hypothetical protein D9M70_532940 [compost metagenome]